MRGKKILTMGIICTLLVTAITGLLGQNDLLIMNAGGASLFVGGAGGGNYTKIQYAIDNASSGDTIFILNGTYNENLVINRSISLVGNGSSSTVIFGDGNNDTVTIISDNVNLTGFFITGAVNNTNAVYIKNAKICSVYNNSIVNNSNGIGINSSDLTVVERNFISNISNMAINSVTSSNIVIMNNTINSTGGLGVNLMSATNSTVLGNTLISANGGVSVYGNSANCTVSYNELNNSGSVNVLSSSFILLKNNSIKDNDGKIELNKSLNITLENNVIDGNRSAVIISATNNATLYSTIMLGGGIRLELNRTEMESLEVTPNNTANGGAVYYYKNVDKGNAIVPGGAGQIICFYVTNLNIENQVLDNVPIGISLDSSSSINIRKSSGSYNSYGIVLNDSTNVIIEDSKFNSNTNTGVLITGTSDDNSVTGTNSSDNKIGIELYTSWNVISRNVANQNDLYGIYASGIDNTTIFGNDCSNNIYGIALEDSGYLNIVANNTGFNNNIGLSMVSQYSPQRDNIFQNNNFSWNWQYGLKIDLDQTSGSRNNGFSNNSFFFNNLNAVQLESASNTEFNSNYFGYNIGLAINAGPQTGNNLIHHNSFIFNNLAGPDVQTRDDGTGNRWNSTGFEGNYWNDYESHYPAATHNGRFWDNPYNISGSSNSRDFFPRVYRLEFERPSITDLSSKVGTTGDLYTILCTINDNLMVAGGHVEYWFGNDTGNSMYLTLDYNPITKNYFKILSLPENSLEPMKYFLSAFDVNRNWDATPVLSVDIYDNDAPVPVATTDRLTYIEGDTVFFNGTASFDNIGIVNYTWYFFYGGKDYYFFTLTQSFTFDIPDNYEVTFTVRDEAGRVASDRIWANITMVHLPGFSGLNYPTTVEFITAMPVTISVTDQNGGGISSVSINYTGVDGSFDDVTMTKVVGDIWSFSIPGQSSAGSVKFTVWAWNDFGKWNRTSEHIIIIVDNDPPRIEQPVFPNSVMVGDAITITASITDNDDVLEVRLTFTDVSTIVHNISMSASGGNNYGYVINGQSKSGVLTFFILASDINGNYNFSSVYSIEVNKRPVFDLILPFVIATQPGNNSENVSITTGITIIFNESMNATGAVAGVNITPAIEFDLIWTTETTLLIRFKENLTANQTYVVTIGRNLTDLAGNGLMDIFVLRFTTIGEIFIDSDGDGMHDDWELEFGLDRYDANDAVIDSDADGLNNLGEYFAGTDPKDSDTDGDNMPDGWEVRNRLDPKVDDADGDPDDDGYSNLEEYIANSNPNDSGSVPKEDEADGSGPIIAIAAGVIVIILVLLVLLIFMRRAKAEEEELARQLAEDEDEFEGSKVKEDIFVADNECPECGYDIGDEETVCPECGAVFAWEDYDEDKEDEDEEDEGEEDEDEWDEWEE